MKTDEATKKAVINACKNEIFKEFAGEQIKAIETLDGYKYFFNNDEWLMIRPSGTEPLLRIYSEATQPERVEKFINDAIEKINNLKIK